MSKKEKTYYGKVLNIHLDDFLKKYEKEPKTPESIETQLLELEMIFVQTAAECINELDSRLRKLEARASTHHD